MCGLVPDRDGHLVIDGPTTRLMSTDAAEELYKLLLDTADDCPLEVVANCAEILCTVLNRRLHDLVPDDEA